jgi:hypothetical protein
VIIWTRPNKAACFSWRNGYVHLGRGHRRCFRAFFVHFDKSLMFDAADVNVLALRLNHPREVGAPFVKRHAHPERLQRVVQHRFVLDAEARQADVAIHRAELFHPLLPVGFSQALFKRAEAQ